MPREGALRFRHRFTCRAAQGHVECHHPSLAVHMGSQDIEIRIDFRIFRRQDSAFLVLGMAAIRQGDCGQDGDQKTSKN